MGYTNVRDYSEGKKDWVDAGLPVEGKGKHRSSGNETDPA
jgi:hypothetical protein